MKKTSIIIAIIVTVITSTVSVLLNTKKIREKNKCEAAIETETAIHDSIIMKCEQDITEIKISDLSKTISWYITKEQEVKHAKTGQNITCIIHQADIDKLVCQIYIDGEEDYENRKYIDGARLYKTTINGKTAYFIADEMFIYTMLWATEDEWVLSLNTKEN